MTNGQTDIHDPYSINLVSAVLKMNWSGQRVIISWGQKGLARLGDRVSVSILKILEPDELKDPQNVRTCLLVIREAFAQPQFISFDADKDPRVTLFLIDYWKQNVPDPDVQDDIHKTLGIVDKNTAR
jgi:hypothetical protein